jgi:hypothetical protein
MILAFSCPSPSLGSTVDLAEMDVRSELVAA